LPSSSSSNPFDVALGARIRDRRRSLKMSQSKLGDRLGVTFQQVQKYERGANRVSISSLVLISEALGCTVGDLLGTGHDPGTVDWSKFEDAQANALVEEFARLPTPELRKRVLELMRSLAEG